MNINDRIKNHVARPAVISNPGTERIVLDTSTIQFMECDSRDKHRYCIVEKGVSPQFSNQFMNAGGDRVHIVTKDVFIIMLNLINNLSRQLVKYKSEAESLAIQSEARGMLIDTLRKNGVID